MRSFDRLLQSLRRLPGIGPKQAERLALHILRASPSETQELVESIQRARSLIHHCPRCYNLTELELCSVCSDPGRDASAVCVVEMPPDVTAVERTRAFRGTYHVLHGALSPLDGVGPDMLRIKELEARVRKGGVREVVVATDPDTEGEATALYLAQVLKPLGVRVTRIAQGIPLGGDLDYTDEVTLTHALTGRHEI